MKVHVPAEREHTVTHGLDLFADDSPERIVCKFSAECRLGEFKDSEGTSD